MLQAVSGRRASTALRRCVRWVPLGTPRCLPPFGRYAAGDGDSAQHAAIHHLYTTPPCPGVPRETERSAPVSTLALRITAKRPQEVNPAKVRPIGVTKVELRVSALPQQEAAESLFARRADHEVGVWLPLRVKVLGDVFDRET